LGYQYTINDRVDQVVKANAKWWTDPTTGQPKDRNRAEMLMLTVSELSEAMEGDRKNLMDDHLPHYPMYVVELVDAMIRIFDQLGNATMPDGRSVNVEQVFIDKMEYNANRHDHTIDGRLAAGGKKY
jgi:hypothetical protein